MSEFRDLSETNRCSMPGGSWLTAAYGILLGGGRGYMFTISTERLRESVYSVFRLLIVIT